MLPQLIISGLAVGFIYGLVALGFVLIYKATEILNFAQGEFMMLGAFLTYTAIEFLEIPASVYLKNRKKSKTSPLEIAIIQM